MRATLWDWSSGYSVAFATRGFSVVASTEGQEDRGVCDRSPAIIRYIVTYGPYYVDDCWVVRDADLLAVAATNGTWEDPMIYLANLSIPELRAGDFDGFTNLEVLVLTSNGLTSLPAGIFDDLTNLRRLYLKDNRLTALPDGIFDKLSALEEVILTYNGDSQLDSGLFEHNPDLDRVFLGNPKLSSVPSDLFEHNPLLTHVGIDQSGLTDVPSDLLSGLTSLPDGFFAGEYDGIRILKLHDNPVGTFHFRMEAEVVSHGVDADGFPTARVRYKIAEGAALTARADLDVQGARRQHHRSPYRPAASTAMRSA